MAYEFNPLQSLPSLEFTPSLLEGQSVATSVMGEDQELQRDYRTVEDLASYVPHHEPRTRDHHDPVRYVADAHALWARAKTIAAESPSEQGMSASDMLVRPLDTALFTQQERTHLSVLAQEAATTTSADSVARIIKATNEPEAVVRRNLMARAAAEITGLAAVPRVLGGVLYAQERQTLLQALRVPPEQDAHDIIPGPMAVSAIDLMSSLKWSLPTPDLLSMPRPTARACAEIVMRQVVRLCEMTAVADPNLLNRDAQPPVPENHRALFLQAPFVFLNRRVRGTTRTNVAANLRKYYQGQSPFDAHSVAEQYGQISDTTRLWMYRGEAPITIKSPPPVESKPEPVPQQDIYPNPIQNNSVSVRGEASRAEHKKHLARYLGTESGLQMQNAIRDRCGTILLCEGRILNKTMLEERFVDEITGMAHVLYERYVQVNRAEEIYPRECSITQLDKGKIGELLGLDKYYRKIQGLHIVVGVSKSNMIDMANGGRQISPPPSEQSIFAYPVLSMRNGSVREYAARPLFMDLMNPSKSGEVMVRTKLLRELNSAQAGALIIPANS